MDANAGVDELLAHITQSPATGLPPIDLRGPVGGMAELGHDDCVGASGLCELNAARVSQTVPGQPRPHHTLALQTSKNPSQRLAELPGVPGTAATIVGDGGRSGGRPLIKKLGQSGVF